MQSLWMLAASLFFAFMGMFIKLASSQHNLGEIVLFRGIPSIIFIVLYAVYHRLPLLGNNLKTHARRNLSGITSMWLGFYSTTHLPLGTASTLIYTSPLFIAAILLYQGYFLGILRLQWLRFGALVLGFIGVLFIFNPLTENGLNQLALLAGLLGGMMAAVAYMTVRSLGQLGEPEWRTVMLFSASVVFSGGISLLFFGMSTFNLQSSLYLLGVGLFGLGGQLCMTRSFSRGSTSLTATLQYSGIIFSATLGYWMWGETIDAMGFFGILLVSLSGLAATLYTRQKG
ncbi:DMT family transporter [Hydromonas duriensis]|uniref:S-adenosylmethionine uptake transporter n=1 Tax=Hydromonas duriensis TaxID=1527608 RepID=A0A4R6Y9L9_9BURK|nr:DMT family transporter [Hydromonas duriensis]TDR32142.1 S-adenosylmethionine uptake transporter [Hydromonas duriensis]